MFVAYKLVQLLIRPELWVMACLVGAWALSRSTNRLQLARRLLLLGILLLYGLGIRPTSDALVRLLETQYPPLAAAEAGPNDAIVVLGGGSTWRAQTGAATIIGTASLHRLICGMTLLREGLAATLVLSGGVGDPFREKPPEAEAMQALALELGVPAAAILAESQSRTTAENAIEVRRMLPHARHIVLVTSELHLPRATALFRKQGFEVTPGSCGVDGAAEPWAVTDFLPSAGTLGYTSAAIHEFVGIAVYRAIGRL